MAKPVASQKTATLLLPSALLEGAARDHSRWNKTEMTVGVARWSQQRSPAHFSFCQLSISNSGSLEIILTIWGYLLGFTSDWTLIALQKPKNNCFTTFSFPTVGWGRGGGGFVFLNDWSASIFTQQNPRGEGSGIPSGPQQRQTQKPEPQRSLACWLSQTPPSLSQPGWESGSLLHPAWPWRWEFVLPKTFFSNDDEQREFLD